MLAITGAIRGTNTVKLYQELGLESLQNKRKLRRLTYFYKIKIYEYQSLLYLNNLILAKKSGLLPNVKEIPTIKVKQIL